MSSNTLKRIFLLLPCIGLLVCLICNAQTSADSMKAGISTCMNLIIPALFPLFAAANLACNLGLHACLGKLLGSAMYRVFGMPGEIASAFFLGITGGYPIGASSLAELRRRGALSRESAERALAFCNNPGPAFIVGAAGVAIFKSSTIGLFLYAIQIISALLIGLFFSQKGTAPFPIHTEPSSPNLANSLILSIRKALYSTVSVCGYVLFFSVISGLLESLGIWTMLCRACVPVFNLPIQAVRSLFLGILELGTGISTLAGLPPTPQNLAICSFILGWGGISVHFQTLAMLAGTDIKAARHTAGRLLCGITASALSYLIFSFLL